MKSKATVKYLSALALSGALVLSMNATPVSAAKKKAKKTSAVKSVKVVAPSGSKKSATVAKGKSIKLTVTVNAKKKSFEKVTYKTSNKKVVSVSKKGVVKGKKAGTATIKVISTKDKKKTASIKVKVVGGVVKKVTLNKSKLDLKTGDSGKLSAKVKATKKAYKTLKWTTSNKNVATVTSKGVVKGIGKGTAKITAAALDGSGKKSTCTVSVSEKNGIKSLEVYSPTKSRYSSTLKVTLDSPQALAADDFKVAIKEHSEGSYIKELTVEDIYTEDNQNYKVYLNGDSIRVGNHVRVTINALNGQKTTETQFFIDSETQRRMYYTTIGEADGGYDEYQIAEDVNSAHKTTIKSGTLPSGLKLLNTRGKSYIIGTPSAVADNQHVVFETTDEFGKVTTTDVNFLIGDDDHIIVENATVGDQLAGKVYANNSLSEYLRIVGGKDIANVEILNSYDNKFTINNSWNSVGILADNSKLAAGTYNVPVKVTDSQGKTGQGTLTIIVSASVKVTTKVNNDNRDRYNICFYNHDLDKEIYLGDIDLEEKTISNTTKEYTGYLPQGTYSVYYRRAGRKVMFNKTVMINGETNLEVTLPTGKITGTIYDVNNKEYADDVTVTLLRSDDIDDVREESVSKYVENGTYSFEGIPDGQYVVIVTGYDNDGKKFKSTSGTITVSGGNVTTDFKLSVANPAEDPQ